MNWRSRSVAVFAALSAVAGVIAGLAGGCGKASAGGPPVKLLETDYSEQRLSGPVSTAVPTESAPVGKVRLGKDIREAVIVEAGPAIRWRIAPYDEPRVLRLGFGRPSWSELPGDIQITAGSGVGEIRELLTQPLGQEHERGWHDLTVSVPACPGGPCWIGLGVTDSETSETVPALAVSNPMLTRGDEAGRPNVILISLDTLGADHLPAYGGPAGLSPQIDALAEDGVLFENAFAISSLTHTSHASMLTGSFPFNTEYVWLDGSVASQVTLADSLRRVGYVTGAFTGGVVLNEEMRFDRGFESFYQFNTLFRGPASRTDIRLLTTRAIEWLARHADVPFFLFLHSYEVHGPFMDRSGQTEADEDVDPSVPQVPLTGPGSEPSIFAFPHMRGRLPEAREQLPRLIKTFNMERKLVSTLDAGVPVDDVGVVTDTYRGEIRFTDRFLGRFIAALEDQGLLDNTILVLTSDHGEAFFEHGLLQHGLLYGETLRVPLIFRFPRRLPSGSRVAAQVSSVDIAPTILDLAGMEIPAGMDGQSLTSLPDEAAAADRSFYGLVIGNGLFWQSEDREKLIVRAGLGRANYGRVELFDLVNDPLEEQNLVVGEGIPPAYRQMVWQTVESMPGIHVDFGSYAGRTFEVEVSWPQAVRDRMYGFDIDSSSCSIERSPDRLSCTMELSETSRMVMLDRRRRRSLDIMLRPVDGGGRGVPIAFQIGTDTVTTERTPVAPRGGEGPPLIAWRRNELVPDGDSLSPEQIRRLRALGYIQ
jgi:arylsulfatase A-like enzyme